MSPPEEAVRPINDRIRDDVVLRAHRVERVKKGIERDVLRFLDDKLYPSLVERLENRIKRIRSRGYDSGPQATQRYRDMISSINGLVDDGMGSGYSLITAQLRTLGIAEATWLTEAMAGALPFDHTFSAPNVRMVDSIVKSRPFQGRFLKDWWAGSTESLKRDTKQAINLGLSQGESTAQIVRRVRGSASARLGDGAVARSKRSVTRVVRTATTHVSAHAREETYAENEDIVEKVQWVSTLDVRTSEICMSLDGKVYRVGQGPRPPAHHQCRSTTTPVLKSWSEFGLKDPPPAVRASMDGTVPGKTTYSEWLKNQSRERQIEALGPAKAKLFREGVPIERFVGADLRPLPVSEILKSVA